MMKKHLFLRLCLMFLVGFSAFSCRTEEFHNEEEAHGNTGLRLTTQRISLSEAKHRTQLLPDLEKAETAIEKKALKVQGKSVNIGNGITIDTDEVIYIENGPDFHTYTFSVIRDNASANAPVENILMTPNTEGSYRVFHIVLNLTEADKAKIANREYVNYKNKEQITELASINLSSLSQKQMCIPHYYSIPVSCTGPEHHMPGEAGCPLEGNDRAYWASIVTYDCFGELPATIMPTPMPIDGGGGGGGECPDCPDNTNPVQCVQIATNPTQVGILDPNGCIVGMPSEPNIMPSQTTCRKSKIPVNNANALLHNTSISSQVSSMESHAANSFTEYGMAITNQAGATIAQDPYSNNDPNNPGTVTINIPTVGDYIANAHTHPSHGAPPPSVADFYMCLTSAKNYPLFQACFIFAGNGTKYAFVVNDRAKAEAFLAAYPMSTTVNIVDGKKMFNTSSQVGKDFITILKDYTQGRLPSYSGSSQNDGLESAFAEILEKYDTGISLAKSDANGNLKPLRSVPFNYTIPAS